MDEIEDIKESVRTPINAYDVKEVRKQLGNPAPTHEHEHLDEKFVMNEIRSINTRIEALIDLLIIRGNFNEIEFSEAFRNVQSTSPKDNITINSTEFLEGRRNQLIEKIGAHK